MPLNTYQVGSEREAREFDRRGTACCSRKDEVRPIQSNHHISIFNYQLTTFNYLKEYKIMTQERIDRINELARLAKQRALTEEEIKERDILRREYIDSVTASLKANLDRIEFVDVDKKKQ